MTRSDTHNIWRLSLFANFFQLLNYCKCISCRKTIFTGTPNKKLPYESIFVWKLGYDYHRYEDSYCVFPVIIPQGNSCWDNLHQYCLLAHNEKLHFSLSARKKKKKRKEKEKKIIKKYNQFFFYLLPVRLVKKWFQLLDDLLHKHIFFLPPEKHLVKFFTKSNSDQAI